LEYFINTPTINNMKEIFYPVHWLPFIWILIQAYLYLSASLFFLRWRKLLVSPVAGMEYGDIAISGSVLLGSLIISTGATSAVFQAAKTLQYAGDNVLRNTCMKFSEFFLTGLLAIGLYIMAVLLNRRIFFRTPADTQLNEGSLAWGILVSLINIGFAIVFWFWLKELSERITPEFINFR